MRFRFLLRLFAVLLILFVVQKVVFMLYNMGMADGAPFLSCLAVLWHGLRLDVATACYLVIIPTVVLIVSFFFQRFPLRRVLVPYYVLIATVFMLAFAVDLVLYSYWGSKPDANDLIYAAKPREALAGLPIWFTIIGFAILALLVWGCVMLMRWVTPRTLPPANSLRSRLVALLFIPVGGLIFLGMRGSVTESTANPSFVYFSPHAFCNHAALNPTFNMFHSLFKVQDLAAEFDIMSSDEVQATLGDSYIPDRTLDINLLRTSRPNVLLIIWEGAGSGMVDNDTVAPNLQSLKREGVFFSRCFANSYRTDRGLVAVLSGWLGLPTATVMKRPDLCRNLPSVASSLAAEGYHTRMTFGGDIDYTNMRMYFMETGFADVRGSETYPSALYTGAWGVPDHYVLTSDLIPHERPFFSTVLTLSSHEPWDVDYHRLADNRQNAFAYTDSCIGVLVDSLRRQPLWDSMLVVIVPDHGCTFRPGQAPADTAVAAIPILWTGGALAVHGMVVDRLMNQTDLVATLLAQMQVDITPFPFSRNVLGSSYNERVPFAVHAVKNHMNLITPQGAWAYDCVSRTLAPADTSRQHFAEALLQHLYTTTAALSSR